MTVGITLLSEYEKNNANYIFINEFSVVFCQLGSNR